MPYPSARFFCWVCLCGTLLSCHSEPEPPNIVLIIGDDHGWQDFGFMNSEVAQTPHLDRLAADGTVFTHVFNTSSVCRPSLQTLLTGLHPLQIDARVSALREAGEQIPRDAFLRHFQTVPQHLAEVGYVSFQGGKYWEGSYQTGGFTEGMAAPHRTDLKGHDRLQMLSGGAAADLGRTTMEPLWKFIDANADRRFFVWYAPKLPHAPHDPGPSHLAPYEDLGLSNEVAGYFGNVTRFDETVGKLIAHLDERGLRERTIVLYLSDNGWDAREPISHPSVGGSRGKLTAYELGFRTPLIVSWPGTLARGTRDDRLISTVDVVATLIDFAGARPLDGRPGKSLKPLLEGDGEFIRESVYGSIARGRRPGWRRGERASRIPYRVDVSFVRTAESRYIFDHKEKVGRLFDIELDPFEEQDLSDRQPEVATHLREDLLRWRADALEQWSQLPLD